MSAFPQSLLVAIAGFFLGTLIFSQLTRWVGLVGYALSKQGGDFLGQPKRRLVWMAPILAVMHPGLAFFLVAVFLAANWLSASSSDLLTWLAGGACVSFTFQLFFFFLVYRKMRAAKSTPRAPNNPLDRSRP